VFCVATSINRIVVRYKYVYQLNKVMLVPKAITMYAQS